MEHSLDDARWTAVTRRDPAADQDFVYAVKTTGVFCRPSSASRLPKRENVIFFETPEAALAAGYRPSKGAARDKTSVSQQHAALISEACRYIATAETAPTLNEMAQRAQMSPYHFHRVFKSVTGLTPKGYIAAHRARKMRSQLHANASITEAIYEAGFNSNSRFYEAADQMLGMRPTEYRDGGARVDIRFAVGQCSLGSILVAQSEKGVCAILLGDDPEQLLRNLQDQFPRANLIGGDTSFERLVAEVVGFIETPALGFFLPLDIRGTAFQQRVWQALRAIPAGTTATYTEIAERIGMPAAVRAVAQACGANRLAVAIPCHRVIRRDGGLSGYRWGIERKRELIEREAKK